MLFLGHNGHIFYIFANSPCYVIGICVSICSYLYVSLFIVMCYVIHISMCVVCYVIHICVLCLPILTAPTYWPLPLAVSVGRTAHGQLPETTLDHL